jgi:hypothetical protein
MRGIYVVAHKFSEISGNIPNVQPAEHVYYRNLAGRVSVHTPTGELIYNSQNTDWLTFGTLNLPTSGMHLVATPTEGRRTTLPDWAMTGVYFVTLHQGTSSDRKMMLTEL